MIGSFEFFKGKKILRIIPISCGTISFANVKILTFCQILTIFY